MFRLAVVALLTASASSFSADNLDPNSKHLRELLKDATLIEGRGLANNQNQNQLAEGAIANLSLKYTGCANVYSMGNGQGGNGGGGQDGGRVRNSAVVSFELREGCNGALVGKYATGLTQFTDSYTESMMTEQEWRCEAFFETDCYACQGADDGGYCYSNCITSKKSSSGTDYSVCSNYMKNQNGQGNANEFEIQRYLECGKMQNNNNNNNNGNNNGNNYNYNSAYSAYPAWDGKYRIGPYCGKDGYSIMLGVFYDEFCSVRAPDSTYSTLYYGATLPYSTKSIIPKSTCVSCVDAQKQYENQQNGNNNNNNNNNNKNGNYNYYNQNWYNMEPRQFCVESYQTAAKCEKTGSSYLYYGGVQTGCDFINNYLPILSSANAFDLRAGPAKNPAAVCAVVFALTTGLFGIYAYFLYRKIKQTSTMALSAQGDLA